MRMPEEKSDETGDLNDIYRSLVRVSLGNYFHLYPNLSGIYFDQYYNHAWKIRMGLDHSLNEEHLLDACQNIFGGEALTLDRFFAAFYHKLLETDNGGESSLAFVREMDTKKFVEDAENVCLGHQIPFIDYCMIVGAYILEKAQQERLVKTEKREGKHYFVLSLERQESQPLEKTI